MHFSSCLGTEFLCIPAEFRWHISLLLALTGVIAQRYIVDELLEVSVLHMLILAQVYSCNK